MAMKSDEKGGFIFQPQAMNITWGDDPRYWKKQKAGAAELIQVCWLEVTVSTDNLIPGYKYEVSFKVSLTENAFGWDNSPIFLMAKIGKKGGYIWKKVMLTEKVTSDHEEFKIPLGNDSLVIEVKPGILIDTKLYFGLYEVWNGKWKGGLKIHEAIVRKLPNN